MLDFTSTRDYRRYPVTFRHTVMPTPKSQTGWGRYAANDKA